MMIGRSFAIATKSVKNPVLPGFTSLGPLFSSLASSSSRYPSQQMQRATPQYSVFGEKSMLSVKVIPPAFKQLRNGSLTMDSTKKGRILLEWTPRMPVGMLDLGGQYGIVCGGVLCCY